MTRKEQVKILDDKIKANKRQHELDRINAVEQARFEYSPLGKVFIDGLDKSDRNEGLLKRLKNIEDRNNNQLLARRNIYRPAIRGKNNGFRNGNNDDDSDDDDNNVCYILSKVIKQKYKKEGILDPSFNKEVYNMIKK